MTDLPPVGAAKCSQHCAAGNKITLVTGASPNQPGGRRHLDGVGRADAEDDNVHHKSQGGVPGAGFRVRPTPRKRKMTFDEFRRSLTAADPPAGLTLALAGLWWDAKGDWTRAHEIAFTHLNRLCAYKMMEA